MSPDSGRRLLALAGFLALTSLVIGPGGLGLAAVVGGLGLLAIVTLVGAMTGIALL